MKEKITISIDTVAVDVVKSLAKDDDRTFSSMVNKLIWEAIDRRGMDIEALKKAATQDLE